jgi:hypothetical protein
MAYLKAHEGEIVTGILYQEEASADVHELNKTPATALSKLPFEKLCPGSAELNRLMETFR